VQKTKAGGRRLAIRRRAVQRVCAFLQSILHCFEASVVHCWHPEVMATATTFDSTCRGL